MMNNPFDLRQLALDVLKNSPSAKKLAREIDEEVTEELLNKRCGPKPTTIHEVEAKIRMYR